MVIGLDGIEPTVLDRLVAAGEMPTLAALRQRAARFLLDHGPAQRTGLAWEHVASGLSPEHAGRWAAVEFDPATYRVWQEGARFDPWWTTLARRMRQRGEGPYAQTIATLFDATARRLGFNEEDDEEGEERGTTFRRPEKPKRQLTLF
jgi:hypothetical protein